ncbi:DUF2024 family protein [Niabella hibiscisoli]|uniref:DUF2024 family protein n=1 Tax=Niabella hibiscisoli TaxID=1825928 RepID=UPI001F0ECE8E|nr:DUF2024 family protein [Niabella hibiscisoli]MCH5718232.1 DUF2024 family protein [Niabella hibiscisoli]
MKISVWDTYVTKKDGAIMHFDILVPDAVKSQDEVCSFGKNYLRTKGQESQSLTASECQFCHIEEATEEMTASIEQRGYHIIEMEGCN